MHRALSMQTWSRKKALRHIAFSTCVSFCKRDCKLCTGRARGRPIARYAKKALFYSVFRPEPESRRAPARGAPNCARSPMPERQRRGISNDATQAFEDVTPIFVRIKRDDRHQVRYDFKSGRVLDLATLAFALTDRNHSLPSACKAFGVPFEDRPGAHSGEITPENVAGCLYDVLKTSELLWALAKEYERHPVSLTPNNAQSGAALAKSYLDALGIQPRLSIHPDFPKSYLGLAARCYFGGRVECRIVHTPVPCVYLDFASMYPTVFSLLNLWFDHLIPRRLEPLAVDARELQEILRAVSKKPEILFEKSLWPRLAFFAKVDPNGAFLPARVEVPTKFAKSLRNIVLGPVESQRPLWYAGLDLAAAAVAGKPLPRILQAWKLVPNRVQNSLRTVNFRSEIRIDPRKEDFFRVLIEQRKRVTDDPLDDELRNTGFKIAANSGAYGDFAETNPADIDPDAVPTPRPVHVYAERQFTTYVDRPESPGRFCFFPTASLVTAGARLLLALGFHEVARAKGEAAYCDTDSLIVVSCEKGGIVPCDAGPYHLDDGRRGVRALSWKKIEKIREPFETLNPYRKGTGPLLKLEDENFGDDGKALKQLWFFGVSEKAYALFNLDQDGSPIIRKYSAHALGQYQSPIAGERTRLWIRLAWQRKIREAFGQPIEPFPWEQLPALAQLTLSTWSVMKPYAQNPNIRPFDFLLVATPTRSFSDFAKRYEVCCADPRPSCFLFDDPAMWESQKWRCLRCGKKFPSLRFRSYASVLHGTLDSFEVKRLCGNGDEPSEHTMRGLTIGRPVRVEKVISIGKEVIVDPTDIDAGLTAETLSETKTLEFHDPEEKLEALRARIRAFGTKRTARECGVSLRSIQICQQRDHATRTDDREDRGRAPAIRVRGITIRRATRLPL
jgi:hypothetical protein